jgi:nucleoside-diphosphate-sugar epimerase
LNSRHNQCTITILVIGGTGKTGKRIAGRLIRNARVAPSDVTDVGLTTLASSWFDSSPYGP